MAFQPNPFDILFQCLSNLSISFTPTVWSDLPKDAQNYFLNIASVLTIEPEAYKRATYHVVQLADLPAAAQDLIQQKLLRQMSTAMFVLDGVLILTPDVMTALSEAELGHAGADPGLVAATYYTLAARALARRSLAARSILGIAAEVATASMSAAAAAALQPLEAGKRVRMVKMARVGTMVRMGKGKILRRASRAGKVAKTVRVPRV